MNYSSCEVHYSDFGWISIVNPQQRKKNHLITLPIITFFGVQLSGQYRTSFFLVVDVERLLYLAKTYSQNLENREY